MLSEPASATTEASLLGLESLRQDLEPWDAPPCPVGALQAVDEVVPQWMAARGSPRFVSGGEVHDVRVIALLIEGRFVIRTPFPTWKPVDMTALVPFLGAGQGTKGNFRVSTRGPRATGDFVFFSRRR